MSSPDLPAPTEAATSQRASYAYFALVVLTLLNLLNYVDRFIFAALIPYIQKDTGYTDEQILAMTSPAEGQTLASAEGRRLPEREGQISVSDEGVSGNSYEGFSATSDPGVRIAEAAPNDSDEGNATEGLSPGDAPDESDKGLIWA